MENTKKLRERIETSIGVTIVSISFVLTFFCPERIMTVYEKLNPGAQTFTAFGLMMFFLGGMFMMIKFCNIKSLTDFYGGTETRKQIGNFWKIIFPFAGALWLLAFLLR